VSPTQKAIVTVVAAVIVIVVACVLARWSYRGMDRYNARLRQQNARPIGPMRYRRLWVIDRESGADDSEQVERQEDRR